MVDHEASGKPTPVPHIGRSTARLAAVQALYQHAMSGTPVERIIADGIRGGFAEALDGQDLVPPDRPLFVRIVRGVRDRRGDVDALIDGALERPWSRDRLELLLVAILRAGAWELVDTAETPTRVVISDYVDVAHAFFDGREPGLVNAVLDRIARRVRDDLGQPAPA